MSRQGAGSERSEITRILLEIRSLDESDAEARERLLEVVYDELRRLARDLLRSERPEHTLSPTALVHEAYIRLIDQDRVRWQNRAHFFGIAAGVMRRVLVDYARRRSAKKRGGAFPTVTLDADLAAGSQRLVEILDLHDALGRMEQLDARMARVVELRAFGGLKVREVAEVLRVSPRTVAGDWSVARLWLSRELSGGAA